MVKLKIVGHPDSREFLVEERSAWDMYPIVRLDNAQIVAWSDLESAQATEQASCIFGAVLGALALLPGYFFPSTPWFPISFFTACILILLAGNWAFANIRNTHRRLHDILKEADYLYLYDRYDEGDTIIIMPQGVNNQVLRSKLPSHHVC